MSVNRFRPHVYVIPEDDANRQIANGFLCHRAVTNERQIQILDVARGWLGVLMTFQNEYVRLMQNNIVAHVVMLVDFDGELTRRRERFERDIPNDISDRVFVIGSLDNPESLMRDMRIRHEAIGSSLADDCNNGANTTWNHRMLMHNRDEVARLRRIVWPILTSS